MDFSDIKDLPPLIFHFSPPILPESISLTNAYLPSEVFLSGQLLKYDKDWLVRDLMSSSCCILTIPLCSLWLWIVWLQSLVDLLFGPLKISR